MSLKFYCDFLVAFLCLLVSFSVYFFIGFIIRLIFNKSDQVDNKIKNTILDEKNNLNSKRDEAEKNIEKRILVENKSNFINVKNKTHWFLMLVVI